MPNWKKILTDTGTAQLSNKSLKTDMSGVDGDESITNLLAIEAQKVYTDSIEFDSNEVNDSSTTLEVSAPSNPNVITLPNNSGTVALLNTSNQVFGGLVEALQFRTAFSGGKTTLGGYGLSFEGSTDDSYETVLAASDPSGDNTINLPDQTGTVQLDHDIFPTNVYHYIANTRQTERKVYFNTPSADAIGLSFSNTWYKPWSYHNTTWKFEIDGVAASNGNDTFKWSKDNGTTWEAEDQEITTASWMTIESYAGSQYAKIKFNSTTGHTLGDSTTVQLTSGSLFFRTEDIYEKDEQIDFPHLSGEVFLCNDGGSGQSSQSINTSGSITASTIDAQSVEASGSIECLSSITGANFIVTGNTISNVTVIDTDATSAQAVAFPDATGTVALTSDIPTLNDTDNFNDASATTTASSESIKTYVDTANTAQDTIISDKLDEVEDDTSPQLGGSLNTMDFNILAGATSGTPYIGHQGESQTDRYVKLMCDNSGAGTGYLVVDGDNLTLRGTDVFNIYGSPIVRDGSVTIEEISNTATDSGLLVFNRKRVSSNAANDNDVIGKIRFEAYSDASVDALTTFGEITCDIIDASSADERGAMKFSIISDEFIDVDVPQNFLVAKGSTTFGQADVTMGGKNTLLTGSTKIATGTPDASISSGRIHLSPAAAGTATHLRLEGAASSTAYSQIETASDGSTLFTTEDPTDSDVSKITIKPEGDVIFEPNSGISKFQKDGTSFLEIKDLNSEMLFRSNGGAGADDYFMIRCNTNGETLLRTWDDTDDDANFTVDAKGAIILDSATGEITVKDNGSNYTPGSDYNIATKKYVDDTATVKGYLDWWYYSCNLATQNYYYAALHNDEYGVSSTINSLFSSNGYNTTSINYPWRLIRYARRVPYGCTVTRFTAHVEATGAAADSDVEVSLWKAGHEADDTAHLTSAPNTLTVDHLCTLTYDFSNASRYMTKNTATFNNTTLLQDDWVFILVKKTTSGDGSSFHISSTMCYDHA